MNDLVRWDEELARDAKEIASLERPAVSQISTRAGVMVYRGQMIPGNKLECIIIASAVERRYDIEAFDPNNIRPPECFALSTTGNDMVPDPSAKNIQNADCDTCPQAQWQPNPKKVGKNHKPCKERRRLALIPKDALAAGNIKSAEIAMLAISVTSVKHWATYVNRLSAEFKRPAWSMLTEIALTPHPQNQFEVKFTPMANVEDEYLSDIRNRIQSGTDALLTPYDTSGMMAGAADAEAQKTNDKARKF